MTASPVYRIDMHTVVQPRASTRRWLLARITTRSRIALTILAAIVLALSSLNALGLYHAFLM
ncbi:MAG TPA: hypothetical protein PK098_07765 [Phycisphaerales bacterium]|nr:hypothetical protein [Phycisphaerales bacterium]